MLWAVKTPADAWVFSDRSPDLLARIGGFSGWCGKIRHSFSGSGSNSCKIKGVDSVPDGSVHKGRRSLFLLILYDAIKVLL